MTTVCLPVLILLPVRLRYCESYFDLLLLYLQLIRRLRPLLSYYSHVEGKIAGLKSDRWDSKTTVAQNRGGLRPGFQAKGLGFRA